MTWQIQWSVPAERTLKALHWRIAARIDAAILRFAESGEGDVFRRAEDTAVTVRLRVETRGVLITHDRATGSLTIWSIYTLPPRR
ncbi:MAG: hypothetical protein U0359_05300 [Byssovorax sp.]